MDDAAWSGVREDAKGHWTLSSDQKVNAARQEEAKGPGVQLILTYPPLLLQLLEALKSFSNNFTSKTKVHAYCCVVAVHSFLASLAR